MAKQSQKSKDKYIKILDVINKYTQVLRSRRKGVEMFLKKKSLKITLKLSNEGLPLTLLPLPRTFREFHKVAAAMANVLMPYWQCFPGGTTSRF